MDAAWRLGWLFAPLLRLPHRKWCCGPHTGYVAGRQTTAHGERRYWPKVRQSQTPRRGEERTFALLCFALAGEDTHTHTHIDLAGWETFLFLFHDPVLPSLSVSDSSPALSPALVGLTDSDEVTMSSSRRTTHCRRGSKFRSKRNLGSGFSLKLSDE